MRWVAVLLIVVLLMLLFYFAVLHKPESVSYYTTDGGKLAPYPDMTDEDLEDFERWAREL